MSNGREVQTVYRDEDFEVKVEVVEGIPFLHSSVYSFSASVLKRMKAVWEGLKEAMIHYGWREVYSYSPNPKFVKMFSGFERIDTITHDGKEYEVLVCQLQQ